MDNLAVQNSYAKQGYNPDLKNNQQSQEFTAIDRERLKQDAAQLSTKVQDSSNDNFILKGLKNLGVEDPKKALKSVALTVLTVVGLATLGNKLSTPTAKLGEKVDDILLNNNNIFGKIYSSVAKGMDSIKDGIKKLPKPKFVNDIQDTMKNRKIGIKCQMARGYERGPVGIFIMTVTDSLENVITKPEKCGLDETGVKKLFSSLVGESKADKLIEDVTKGGLSMKGQTRYKELTKDIVSYVQKNYKGLEGKTQTEILELLSKNQIEGLDVSALTKINMTGNLMSGWWPVNILNSAASKIGQAFKKDPSYNANFCRGNLFDSLIKFSAVNNSGAKTMPGKFVQKMTTIPTECISNFVNDKSGLGVLLAKGIYDTYNNVQDAPDDKKASTLANDFAQQTLGWVLTMPIAYKLVYSVGSLKNLEGNGIISKVLKQAGKFFGMGLDYYKDGAKVINTNKVTGLIGGVMRFAAIMFVINPIISKQISKFTNKIFGKPYDKAEEERQKQLEAQKNQIIPELGITQGQLIEKIQNNPQAVQRIQQDPKLIEAIQKDPKVLLNVLDGKDINAPATVTQPNSKPQMSQANASLLNNRKNNQSQQQTPQQQGQIQNNNINTNTNTPASTKTRDTATYIPSSDPISKRNASSKDTVTYIPSSNAAPVQLGNLSEEQTKIYNEQMANADKVLARAEKFI